jgi:hypothetical protein
VALKQTTARKIFLAALVVTCALSIFAGVAEARGTKVKRATARVVRFTLVEMMGFLVPHRLAGGSAAWPIVSSLAGARSKSQAVGFSFVARANPYHIQLK